MQEKQLYSINCSGSDHFEADQLFAALDTVTRKNLSWHRVDSLYRYCRFVPTPTALIESFKATLEDLRSRSFTSRI